jgi:hypothetical protein
VGVQSLDDLAEGDIFLDGRNLDSDAFAPFRLGNDDDESAFDTGESVTLVAHIFDLDRAGFSLLDGRRWWALPSTITSLEIAFRLIATPAIAASVVALSVIAFGLCFRSCWCRVGLCGLVGGRRAEEANSIDLIWLNPTDFDFALWDFDEVGIIFFDDPARE